MPQRSEMEDVMEKFVIIDSNKSDEPELGLRRVVRKITDTHETDEGVQCFVSLGVANPLGTD